MPTWRGRTYTEAAASKGESATYTLEPGQSTGTRVFICDWEDAPTLARDLVGYEYVTTGTGGYKYIKRVPPYPDPWFLTSATHGIPVQPYLFCNRCEVRGEGMTTNDVKLASPTDFPKHTKARLTLSMTTLPYNVKEDYEISVFNGVPDESAWERYVSFVFRPQGEFLTIRPTGGNRYRYVTTVSDITYVPTDGIAKLLSAANIQVTWHRVPEKAVPSVHVNPSLTSEDAIEDTIGTVNDRDFNGFPKATLLLLGASLKPDRSVYGNRTYDVTYMFKFNPNTHQKLFDIRTTPAVWTEVTTDGVTNLVTQAPNESIYNWENFARLFRVSLSV